MAQYTSNDSKNQNGIRKQLLIFLLDHFSRIYYDPQLMFLADISLMIRLIRKISAITLACLTVLNVAAGAAVVVGHCPSSMGSSSLQ